VDQLSAHSVSIQNNSLEILIKPTQRGPTAGGDRGSILHSATRNKIVFKVFFFFGIFLDFAMKMLVEKSK